MNALPSTPNKIREYLQSNGFENPILETKLILCEILSIPFDQTDPTSQDPLSRAALTKLEAYYIRLRQGEPIQCQIGYTYVSGIKILLSNETLCPGPEIEILLDATREVVKMTGASTIVDVCTGSGAIGSVLAKEFTNVNVFATDISEAALNIARQNQRAYCLNNLTIKFGNLLEPLKARDLENSIDVIVSNPPYCKTTDIVTLPVQVRGFAPRIAIDGGDDGMDFHRRIIIDAQIFLKVGGFLILENESGQSQAVQHLLKEKYSVSRTISNNAGIPRIIVAQYKPRRQTP